MRRCVREPKTLSGTDYTPSKIHRSDIHIRLRERAKWHSYDWSGQGLPPGLLGIVHMYGFRLLASGSCWGFSVSPKLPIIEHIASIIGPGTSGLRVRDAAAYSFEGPERGSRSCVFLACGRERLFWLEIFGVNCLGWPFALTSEQAQARLLKARQSLETAASNHPDPQMDRPKPSQCCFKAWGVSGRSRTASGCLKLGSGAFTSCDGGFKV